MNENFEVEVSHATAVEFKSTEIGEAPNNINEEGDQLYDNFPELHSKAKDKKDARECSNCNQVMETRHHCGRSVFYVGTNLKKANSCSFKRIINNVRLLSFKENSTARKVKLESYAKEIYDYADREMKMVDLVDSTVAEGWVYVSAGWNKKELASKQNKHQAIGLTCFQSINEGFCDDGEAKTSHFGENNNKIKPFKAKANRERQELQRSNTDCKLFTMQGTRELRVNTESIVMNFSLCGNKFSQTEMKKEANVNTKEGKNSLLVAEKRSEKHKKKSKENSKFGLGQDEYVEMCSKDQPQQERKHAEHQYYNNKEVDDEHSGSLEETIENKFYNSENTRFEERKSLNKVDSVEKVNINNSEKVINSSNEIFFRPSPMPRKQTIKPRPKPRTKSSTLLPNKNQPRTIRNRPSCVKEKRCHENVELQSQCPETSNVNELLTGSRGCPSLNHVKPIPSPRQKSPSASSPVQLSPQYPSFVSSNSVEDLYEAESKISLSTTEPNTQSTSPPPRPPKTYLLERQTSLILDSQPKTNETDSLLKLDEHGYLVPVNDCSLSEKTDSNFVCMTGSPPLLPRKSVTKNDNFSTPASESRKAKTLVPDGKLPLKSKLLFEPSTFPRLSGFNSPHYEMMFGQCPWYACRDITRESFIEDCPLWPYEYLEDWLPPHKINKNTSDKIMELQSEISKLQNEPRHEHEATVSEQKDENLSSYYVDMNSPPLGEESCYQICDQEYEEVQFSPDKKGKELVGYYEDIEVNTDGERNKDISEQYEEIQCSP